MPAISHAQLSPGCAHEWAHRAWEKREKGLGKIREMDAVLLGLQLPAHTIPMLTRGTLTAAESRDGAGTCQMLCREREAPMPGEGIWERLIPSLQKSLVSLSCPQSSLLCGMPSLTFLFPHPCVSQTGDAMGTPHSTEASQPAQMLKH